MAVLAGKGGSVTFASGYTAHVDQWSCDRDVDLPETTDFDSSGDKQFEVVGLKGATFKYRSFVDDTTVLIDVGVSGAATFKFSATRTLSGTVVIESFSTGPEVAGTPTVEYTTRLTGALTIA